MSNESPEPLDEDWSVPPPGPPPPPAGGYPPVPGYPPAGGAYGYPPAGYTPGYGYPPYGYPAPRTNGNAIASLVCGVAAWAVCGLVAIPGLVLGLRARRQIRDSNGGESGDALALAGTIISGIYCGLIAIGIVVVVILLLVGTFSSSSRLR